MEHRTKNIDHKPWNIEHRKAVKGYGFFSPGVFHVPCSMFRVPRQGFSLVELVVGLAILSLVFMGLVSSYNAYIARVSGGAKAIRAAYLLEEGLEATRIIRDGGFQTNIASLTLGSDYYLSFSGSAWSVNQSTPEYIDGVLRKVVFDAVYRDGNSDITPSGTLDTGTKKVTVTVSYPSGTGTTTKSLATYLTDLFGN